MPARPGNGKAASALLAGMPGMSAVAPRIANVRLLGLLGLLYFAQGLPSGLLAKALPPLLREQGVSLSAIGLTGLLAAPWAMKFLWAPFVERTGTRRHWLLALNAITLALMAALAMRDFSVWVGDAFVALLILLFALNLVAATQDVVTDGLAVSRLTASLRGIGNSLQVIGYKIGMTLGSAVLLWLVAHWGWSLAYGALAALLVPVLIAAWWVAEPAPGSGDAAPSRPWMQSPGPRRSSVHAAAARPARCADWH